MPACFFIGHHDAPESVFPALARAVERHITEYGVTEFVVGHYGAFDRLAARAVRDAKQVKCTPQKGSAFVESALTSWAHFSLTQQ